MPSIIFSLSDLDKSMIPFVGGKAANLGELNRIPGVCVPAGCCITTDVFRNFVTDSAIIGEAINQLSQCPSNEREKIKAISASIRSLIEEVTLPPNIISAIWTHLQLLGEEEAYAIRSSATAEDLPTASFAGQQDTFLNIVGMESIKKHIVKCWASLFSDRAVSYRGQQGFDHRRVSLAVVIQRMLIPQSAGILFTADPVSSHRGISSIDAAFGLGDSLVSGLIPADNYRVIDEKITDKKIADKRKSMRASRAGGTKEEAVSLERSKEQVLTDAQIVELARIGRTIETHFGSPQDIEWCLVDGAFHIVQSRPITTLFPIPETMAPGNRVYLSVGHQQMMTDPFRPLGISFRILTTPAPMGVAGGRLFVDATERLRSTSSRKALMELIGKSDPLTVEALEKLVTREGFIEMREEPVEYQAGSGRDTKPSTGLLDPHIATELILENEKYVTSLRKNIWEKTGTGLFDFILEDLQEMKRWLFDPRNMKAIMAGMDATIWLNELMWEWLGEKGVADILSQSAPNNITSEMGLELMDVSDTIRAFPEVVGYLRELKQDDQLEGMPHLVGGKESQRAIADFLDKHGIRCTGEIDITNTRWSEKPAILVPMILSNIRNFEAGESKRKFDEGLREAARMEGELLERLYGLQDGERKAAEAKRMIDQLRAFIGYREYPKYAIVWRYYLYKEALMKEAERLFQDGVIREPEDVYYLYFEEFRELVSTGKVDQRLIEERREAFRWYERLRPPRVMTSEGEIITTSYRHERVPDGALLGQAVSAGVIEGRARVISRMEEADLEKGDILVTAYTDPSWTTLFVSIKGLVTEVGSLMTHGAVIAREYGLPAVVGVDDATRLIRDGQRIRVNGTDGYVELLDD